MKGRRREPKFHRAFEEKRDSLPEWLRFLLEADLDKVLNDECPYQILCHKTGLRQAFGALFLIVCAADDASDAIFILDCDFIPEDCPEPPSPNEVGVIPQHEEFVTTAENPVSHANRMVDVKCNPNVSEPQWVNPTKDITLIRSNHASTLTNTSSEAGISSGERPCSLELLSRGGQRSCGTVIPPRAAGESRSGVASHEFGNYLSEGCFQASASIWRILHSSTNGRDSGALITNPEF